MNREETKAKLLEISNRHNNILCQLPTGYGKSFLSLEIVKQHGRGKVLVVIPRLVLIDNWKEEIKKWDMKVEDFTFTTYISLEKHAGNWDYVIFDECQHLTERCLEALPSFNIKRTIFLSATVKYTLKNILQSLFHNLYVYRINMKEAIDNEVLPDPNVILIPLTLDNRWYKHTIVKNPKAKVTVKIPYEQKWKYRQSKLTRVEISCTQKQYHDDMCDMIQWYKNKFFTTNRPVFKNLWLKAAGDRLIWLSNQKNDIVKKIIDNLNDKRVLTFCNSIAQTELLGKYCINSKNKESMKFLEQFNKEEINHITAVNMLNEGCNLSNCQIALYASLNSSEIMIIQKQGRAMRHKNPYLIIPYFKNTREQEIVEKMCENYNKEKITVIDDINKIRIN